jgi:transposase InsO family protein
VRHLAGEYPVRWPCRLFGCPRAGLYRRPTIAGDEADLRRAVEELAGARPTYGYRRVTVMLRRDGWVVNAKRVRRVMDELGLAAEPVKRRVRTTNSDHPFPRYPNLVADSEVLRPDQVWVADITYVRVRVEFVYLAAVMDVFTRCVRGWEVSRSLDQSLTLGALLRALRRGRPEVHHSDQGVQYAAAEYIDRLTRVRSLISMAAVGEPRENGYAERLMRTIKEEAVQLTEYQDYSDARRQLGRFLDAVYNRKRIHSALGYLTPAEFEHQWRAQGSGPRGLP